MSSSDWSVPGDVPEYEFLQACLRGRWDSQALRVARNVADRGTVEWAALQRIVDGNELAPLLYSVVRDRDVVVPTVEEKWAREFYRTGARNAVLLDGLHRVLRSLTRAGIPVIVLKGADLAESLYPSIALRPMEDLDLLVPMDELPRAVESLSRSHELVLPMRSHANVIQVFDKHDPGRRPGVGPVLVELHCNLIESPYPSHLEFVDWLWNSAQSGVGTGGTVKRLVNEALILQLCSHFVNHSRGKKLLWLHDIAEVIVASREQIDWDSLVANSARFDLVGVVHPVLTCVAEMWNAPVPADVQRRLAALRPSRRERAYFSWVGRRAQSYPALLPQASRSLGARLWQLAYLRDNVLPPPGYMLKRYGIRRGFWLPLSYPFRWFRKLRNMAVHLSRFGIRGVASA